MNGMKREGTRGRDVSGGGSLTGPLTFQRIVVPMSAESWASRKAMAVTMASWSRAKRRQAYEQMGPDLRRAMGMDL